jgi:hypothetical protein
LFTNNLKQFHSRKALAVMQKFINGINKRSAVVVFHPENSNIPETNPESPG